MSRESNHNHPLPPLKPSSTTVSPPTPTTTHPSSDNNSTTSHQSETAIHNNHPTKQPPSKKTPSFPVREDCWSEDATFTLIEAWGDRFLQLNRGNLRQKHWQEVADTVNARHGHFKKARRTDVQCKNRIDTLKKKYKVEKSKALAANNNNYVSSWPFFPPLDSLIGSIFIKTLTKTPTPPIKRKRVPTTPSPSVPLLPPPPSSVPVGRRSKRPAPPLYQLSTDSSFFRRNFSVMAAAAAVEGGGDGGGGGDSDDSDTSSWSSGGNGKWSGRRRRSENRKPRRIVRVEKEEEMEGDPYEKLAEAIGRFAGVYARVEEAKQRQMVELEKQRMRFTKDLELQRIKLLMESQVQLEKLKQLKTNSEADFHRIDEEDHSTSVN